MLQVREVDPSCLKPWEGNPRLNDCAIDAVAKSISEFGFNVPILCDRDFTIVAGHTRWKAAKRLGLSTVPVITLDLTDTQRRAFAIADNKTAEIAGWDFAGLQEVLERLRSEDVDLSSLGYSDAELQALLVPEEDFDWQLLAQAQQTGTDKVHVLLPIKILSALKTDYKKAIQEVAAEAGIEGEDFSIVAGKVVGKLLGVQL